MYRTVTLAFLFIFYHNEQKLQSDKLKQMKYEKSIKTACDLRMQSMYVKYIHINQQRQKMKWWSTKKTACLVC